MKIIKFEEIVKKLIEKVIINYNEKMLATHILSIYLYTQIKIGIDIVKKFI
jgi:hypothetical protein